MTMSGRKMFKAILALIFFSMALSGCDGRVLVINNVFFMGVTCVMLWSTINLK